MHGCQESASSVPDPRYKQIGNEATRSIHDPAPHTMLALRRASVISKYYGTYVWPGNEEHAVVSSSR